MTAAHPANTPRTPTKFGTLGIALGRRRRTQSDTSSGPLRWPPTPSRSASHRS